MIRNRRGSTLLAALVLAFLIFATTTLCLGRVASSYARFRMNQGQTTALFLAEAGIRKAAHRLSYDTTYTGEHGTRLDTGAFDVTVSHVNNRYILKSTGLADSPFKRKPTKSVEAEIVVSGPGAFRISKWREDP